MDIVTYQVSADMAGLPFDEGYDAFNHGISENPYDADRTSYEYHKWSEGWEQAMKDDLDRTLSNAWGDEPDEEVC